ncbi:AtzE family amidohydrolase [Roseateles violae]|uniref:AtzE family amidohydrolase n=1 Tax=Roseateles violae TaxID=3058042 RepID=A0ABT8DSN3_9BURK|nr:AtzE family amidohydrolase [Pelomonas sp. PFR6]MDN3920068.1 AtzE family amidohydrolase [Pelomonas sp. PFR6]
MNEADALLLQPAHAIAAAVRAGRVSAEAMAEASLARIARSDGLINAFTDLTAARALAGAQALDRRLRAGDPAARALPLPGVPYAVKNLFDIEGLSTLAGSKIERGRPPASGDGPLLRRLDAAGALLVGALNMDEYAYGFTTENSHEGPTRNPRDPTRVAGGSSGGSGAAVAAGQVPISLGSDTNGSIRVPASLCGVFGLKPTFGRLPRNGSYPFVASLDHLGPFARSVPDLALTYDALQGFDAADPGCQPRAIEPTMPALARGREGLRIARLDGYFLDNAGPEARAAVARVAEALGGLNGVELAGAERARAAAFLISNAQGAALHLPDLRSRARDFEPLSRDRFLAGALLPAAWVQQAQRVRRWFALRAAELFREVDVLIAPATPVVAPVIGSEWIDLNGRQLPARPSLGLLTQPISCIGLPVCAAPVWGVHERLPHRPRLPIGVQIIAAPWREDHALRVAHALEQAGVSSAPVAELA